MSLLFFLQTFIYYFCIVFYCSLLCLLTNICPFFIISLPSICWTLLAVVCSAALAQNHFSFLFVFNVNICDTSLCIAMTHASFGSSFICKWLQDLSLQSFARFGKQTHGHLMNVCCLILTGKHKEANLFSALCSTVLWFRLILLHWLEDAVWSVSWETALSGVRSPYYCLHWLAADLWDFGHPGNAVAREWT